MVEVKAKLSYLRIAPRKVALVAKLVRGKNAAQAREILKFTPNKPAVSLLKLLNAAITSAQLQHKVPAEQLFLKKLLVNEGPTLKRIQPRARGQAFQIHKRMTHIQLVLAQRN